MKLTHNWLKEYVDFTQKPQELAHMLTMAGFEVACLEKVGSDWVYEFEITPNRPDCLSVIGLAREISAITGGKLTLPKIKPIPVTKNKGPFQLTLDDDEGCLLYTGILIENVANKPSPKKLVTTLEAMGLRSINAIVDITNYILLETGQPLHAFDHDTLTDHHIIVRTARKKEPIITIDESEVALTGTELVIADSARAVALAGIMGGKATEVTAATKNILLESAFFDPLRVRRGCRSTGVRSDSSYRFERRVDIENVERAADRAAHMIVDMTGGSVRAKKIAKSKKYKKKNVRVTVSLQEAEQLLGCPVPKTVSTRALKALGFSPAHTEKGLRVTVPSFRPDVNIPRDIVEELARVIGYEAIPETLPVGQISGMRLVPVERVKRRRLRDSLVGMGLYETITYSLLNREVFYPFGYEDKQMAFVRNPLSKEQECLRPTVLAGLLAVAGHNRARHREPVRVFEITSCYVPRKKEVDEPTRLGIIVCGEQFYNWAQGARELDLFDLKGLLETLQDIVDVPGTLSFKEESAVGFIAGRTLGVYVGAKKIGVCGQIDAEVAGAYHIDDAVYAAEIDCALIIERMGRTARYVPLPKFPSALRDLALVVDNDVPAGAIECAIRESAGPHLITLRLFDVYRGKQIASEKKSLAFSLEYRDEEKTLTDNEITQLQQKIIGRLSKEFAAEIRA